MGLLNRESMDHLDGTSAACAPFDGVCTWGPKFTRSEERSK
jgi:hypothetical protein